MQLSRLLTVSLGVVLFVAESGAQTAPRSKSALTELSDSLEEIARQISPAVVQVLVSGYKTGPSENNDSVIVRQQGTGSGVIVDPSGYIITNNHVIEGSARVRVVLSRSAPRLENPILEAAVVGVDRETDLAVLKIEQAGLPALRLENSELLRQGQIVLAFGSPLGLQNSMSMGVVSSIARQMNPDDTMAYIQTDAPINPGSSGGPLLDTHGHVVGINTFIYSQSGGSQGLGFAVPSSIVQNVYTQIRKNGRVIRGVIGVNDYTITPVLAQGLHLPQEYGVLLADVYPDSPADKAGLKPLDIVLTLDGKRMQNARQFDVGIYARSEGDVVTIEVLRGHEKLSIPVTVAARQENVDVFSGMASVSKNSVRKLNILGISLTQQVAQMLPDLRSQYGVLVAAKTFDPLTQEIDLEIGDVITAINGNPVSSLEALRSALDAMKRGDPVVLFVERQGKIMLVSFEYE